jgi:hypothetical protein
MAGLQQGETGLSDSISTQPMVGWLINWIEVPYP